MDFIKKNIKIIVGIIVLVVIASITFITLFIGNNEEKVTTESETTAVENNQENATNDKMVSVENEDASVAAVNNDSSVSSPAINISEPYKGTHFEWQPSNDLFFIHPDSQYIASESFDNDNEAPLDEAKAKAEEDCSVLGGNVSHSIFRVNDNAEVTITCIID